jgi:predicted RNA-binding protein YlqC (UPF0109 family)
VKHLVETIVRNLVDRPDEVEVEEENAGRSIRYVVRVAEPDRGNVIGRGGQTAQALRTLLNGMAQKHRRKVDVDIVD